MSRRSASASTVRLPIGGRRERPARGVLLCAVPALRHGQTGPRMHLPLVLAVLLLLGGCSSSTPANRAPNTRTAATPAASVTPGAAGPTAAPSAGRASPTPAPLGVFAAMLQLVPDTPETRQQTTVDDYARVRQTFNIAAPADPAKLDQKQAYLAALNEKAGHSLAPTFLSGLDAPARQTATLETYLGYRHVDQDLAAGLPPRVYEALRGQFDPQAAAQQIAAWDQRKQDPGNGCPDCPPTQTASFNGVPYYSWGDDFAAGIRFRLAPPAFDQLGRGGRVAVEPQLVLRALWTEGLQQMIAASQGGPSLAANADFRLAAESLERLGTFGAFFTTRTQGPDQAAAALATGDLKPEERTKIGTAWNPPAGTPVLAPYTLIAAGVGQGQDGQPFTGIVLVHASELAAQQNAALLPQRIAQTSSLANGQPWSSLLPHVQTSVSGRALLVTLADTGIGPEFLLRNDPLLLHR